MSSIPGQEAGRFFPGLGGRGALLLAGWLLTAAVTLLQAFAPAPLREAQNRLYDLMLGAREQAALSPVPVLVGVDDASLAEFGQWPWPRYRLAMLVDRLQQRGAEVVALDFLMPEADRTSPGIIRAERRRDRADPGALPGGEGSDENTARLADSLRRGKAALGYYLDFSGAPPRRVEQPPPALPTGTVLRSEASDLARPLARGELRSHPQLAAAAAAEGFTNALHDTDGTLRRVPLLLPAAGDERVSLALAALMLSTGERQLELLADGGERALAWNGRRIPLDAAGNLLVDFRSGSPAFPYLSAGGVLHDVPGQRDLAGRIVFVGAWAKGLGDLHRTPSGRLLNGVEVHATVVDNLLSGSFVTRPAWAPAVELLALVLIGAGLTWVLSRAGFRLSLLAVLAVGAGCYWGARQLLVASGIYLSPLLPMLLPVAISTVLSLLKYGLEARKVRLRTRDLLEAQDTIIIGMSALAEARDKETGHHLLRTRRYVELLARQLSRTPKYAHLQPHDIELMAKSAPLHDIGKVGIPDSILHKPGKLSPEEYGVMQQHPLIGADALTRVVVGTGHPEKHAFLHYAKQMIESHHERWDGSGYPHRLCGDAIPLPGRLMALADVYDALVSRRVYKQGMSHADVRDFIVQASGSHFDPDVVAAFLATEGEFADIAQRYADPPEPAAA